MTTYREALAAATTSPAPAPAQFTGYYDAAMMLVYLNAGVVADALEPGMTLVPAPGAPQGTHPVILTFGTESSVLLKGVATPLNYQESVVGIPNVQPSSAFPGRVATFMPRLDVDDALAASLGWLVGYTKTLSVITSSPGQFQIATLLSRATFLTLTYAGTTAVGVPTDFPNFAGVADFLKQPLVSMDTVGNLIFTVFNWHLDSAKLQGVKATLTTLTELRGLPQGTFSFPGFDTAVMGAGRIQVSWDLTGPFPNLP